MVRKAGWEVELTLRDRGFHPIVGLDEVGRGAWAGPLMAGVFCFESFSMTIDLADSKLLTAPKREALADQLKTLGQWAVAEVSNDEIDRLGLATAQLLAYELAVADLGVGPGFVLLDGRPLAANALDRHPQLVSGILRQATIQTVVGGDASVASIAAAAIMAKVARDAFMKTVAHERYPVYGFDRHVGYGTKKHQAALAEFGPSPLHRRSYRSVG